jgi:hypothetical protein
MADAKLDLMRRLLREKDEKKNTGGNRSAAGDKASYPYWNIPERQTATVRFLPDKDDNNPWFWAERQVIKLPFDGVVGGETPTSLPQLVTVPCMDMFEDKTCPIIAATRPLWSSKDTEEVARKYWKKRSYIAQGFVVSSPFNETEPPANPIRRLLIGFSLLEKLEAGLRDTEMLHNPTDYINGTDFKIKKTRKGDYNNYDTSEWSRRTRPLSESEQIAIEQYGLFDLKDFKGARPDADGMAMIKAMFKASMAGEPFDMAAFGAHYRPFAAYSPANAALPEGVDDFATTPKNTGAAYVQPEIEPATVSDGDDSPKDLLDKLRSRVSARA